MQSVLLLARWHIGSCASMILYSGPWSLALGMIACSWTWSLVLGHDRLFLDMITCSWHWSNERSSACSTLIALGHDHLFLDMIKLPFTRANDQFCSWPWSLRLALDMIVCYWTWSKADFVIATSKLRSSCKSCHEHFSQNLSSALALFDPLLDRMLIHCASCYFQKRYTR